MSRRADSTTDPATGRGTALLVVVALGVFFAADDQTSIVAVLPAIIPDIGIAIDDFYQSSWIVNGYLLGYLVALPLHGRVADVYGRGHVFVMTLGIFVIGSVLVAVAPNFGWLVAARTVQAVGGGGVVPVAMAIVADELPAAKRAFGLGAIAAASESGALLGPLWGGAITEWFGWRWVFWVNVPLALPLMCFGWRLLRDRGHPGRIDWLGGALLTAGLAVLTFALVDDPLEPRAIEATFAMLAASAALVAAFVWHEQRAQASMIRLAMFRARPVWSAHAASVLVGGGLIAALIGVPLFVNLVLGGSPLDGGLVLARLTAAVPVGALIGGWAAGRFGLRLTAVTGILLAAAGFAGLQAWSREMSEALRAVPLLIGGFGFGLVIAPLGAAVLQQAGEGERATASAWLTMSRVLGMLIGTALLTSHGLGRFYARASNIEFGTPEFVRLVQEAQLSTFREVFVAAVVVMLCAAVVAALIGRGRAASGARWWLQG